MSQETFKQLAQAQITSATAASIYSFGIVTALDVDTIDFQNGHNGGSIQRYAFNGTPDLSGVTKGMIAQISSSTNASNDGTFFIVAVSDANDTIDIHNPNRNDNTDDEATDSPSVVSIKPTKAVVIKAHRIVENSGAESGVRIYHDDDGTTYTDATIIYKNLAIPANDTVGEDDVHIFSDDATMNIAAKIESAAATADDVTITLYGYYIN